MLASNPVDPSQRITISYLGDPGPSSPWPRRDDERGLGNTVAVLGAAALLVLGYIVGGFASASAAPMAPVGGTHGGAPVAVTDGPAPIATPVVGEFRLGPGNNRPPGIGISRPEIAPGLAAPVVLPSAVPGDFRLGPGNNAAPGLVPVAAMGVGALPHDLHGGATRAMPADEILPFE